MNPVSVGRRWIIKSRGLSGPRQDKARQGKADLVRPRHLVGGWRRSLHSLVKMLSPPCNLYRGKRPTLAARCRNITQPLKEKQSCARNSPLPFSFIYCKAS